MVRIITMDILAERAFMPRSVRLFSNLLRKYVVCMLAEVSSRTCILVRHCCLLYHRSTIDTAHIVFVKDNYTFLSQFKVRLRYEQGITISRGLRQEATVTSRLNRHMIRHSCQ